MGIYIGGTEADNHLEDYEEGSWTPDIRGHNNLGSTNLTYSVRGGTYRKVGSLVFIEAIFRETSLNGNSGNTYLFGLPFAPVSGDTSIINMVGDQFSYTGNQLFWIIEGGNNRAVGGRQTGGSGSSAGWGHLTLSSFTLNGGKYISGCYTTS